MVQIWNTNRNSHDTHYSKIYKNQNIVNILIVSPVLGFKKKKSTSWKTFKKIYLSLSRSVCHCVRKPVLTSSNETASWILIKYDQRFDPRLRSEKEEQFPALFLQAQQNLVGTYLSTYLPTANPDEEFKNSEDDKKTKWTNEKARKNSVRFWTRCCQDAYRMFLGLREVIFLQKNILT